MSLIGELECEQVQDVLTTDPVTAINLTPHLVGCIPCLRDFGVRASEQGRTIASGFATFEEQTAGHFIVSLFSRAIPEFLAQSNPYQRILKQWLGKSLTLEQLADACPQPSLIIEGPTLFVYLSGACWATQIMLQEAAEQTIVPFQPLTTHLRELP